MSQRNPASILLDVNGNLVGVIQDGTVYRLQVEAKIAGREVRPDPKLPLNDCAECHLPDRGSESLYPHPTLFYVENNYYP